MRTKLALFVLLALSVIALGQVEIESVFTIYWDDLRFPAAAETLPAGAANITVDTTNVGLSFETDAVMATDWLIMNAQMPHGYEFGSNLFPHVHWVQTEDNTPNWLIQYRCNDIGEDPTGGFTSVAWTTDAITYVSGTIHQLTSFPNFDPEFSGVSGMCDIKLYRDTNNTSTLFAGADPFTTDVLLKEFDFHYKANSLGSVSIFSKW